jgi:outer membrane protein insertion porin family/translocation and assembly module TamA
VKLLVASLVSLLALSCTHAPDGRFELTRVKVTGNHQLDDDEIEDHIASHETPKFLGLFPGVIYDYETFNRFVLERVLQRIERFYQSRGYYRAHVRAGRTFVSGSHVHVEIVVEEGEPVLLRRVDVHGLENLPPKLKKAAEASVTSELTLNVPFEEGKLDAASKALARTLGDAGYAEAQVRTSADVSLPTNVAAAGFWVDPGSVAEIGEVTLQGLGKLPEAQIRTAIGLKPGMLFSQAELDEAKRALLDLGIFASVEVDANVAAKTPGPNGKPRIPIVVKLEQAKLRSVRLGGGVMVDALKSDAHLTFGWEDQSFLGHLRKMEIELMPGVVFYPTRFPSFQAPQRLLPEGRLRSELRQPSFLARRMSLVLKDQVAIYPALLSSAQDPAAPIIGYVDNRTSIGVERAYHRLFGTLAQNLQVAVPFAYSGSRDRDLKGVVVSYPSLYSSLDLRDNSLHPHHGLFLANELEIAGVGGDARDVKVQPEIRGYVPVGRRLTLAARTSIGLLFAQNYGSTIESNALTGIPPAGTDRRTWVRDVQLMFLRGFFAGGPGSNRGYAPREIGPHGVVPFYNHGQSLDSAQMLRGGVDCTAGSATYEAAVCDLPLGGFTLWEASLELRFPISGALTGTTFGDAADVAPRAVTFRFGRPHLSVGGGLRYDTPVGPIRLDLGFRIPGAQAPTGAADEGTPATMLGLPLALSFGIGEAF